MIILNMKQSTKNHLLGCLDTMLFMPRAGERFSGSFNHMMGSFVLLSLLFPIMLLSVLLAPAPEIAQQSQNLISIAYSLRFCITLAIFFGFVYLLASKTDRRKDFFKFVTAYNWLCVPIILMSLPITLMMASTDPVTSQQGLILSYVFLIYSFAFTAYIAACTLRIPIELAAFIAITSFHIDASSYEVVDWVGSVLS